MANLLNSKRTYTKDTIQIFLRSNGTTTRINNEQTRDDTTQQKLAHLIALGLTENIVKALHNETIKVPKMYSYTRAVTIFLSIASIILLLINLYVGIFNVNSIPFISLLLSSISLYYTNKIAMNDWKKLNGKTKHQK